MSALDAVDNVFGYIIVGALVGGSVAINAGNLFNRAHTDVETWEGGYVNHQLDPGGETYRGITRATATANGWSGPLQRMPDSLILHIYYSQYWQPANLDEIAEYDLVLATLLYHINVNSGPTMGVRVLQRCLRTLENPRLQIDGKFGPATRTAWTMSRSEPGLLRHCVRSVWTERYLRLVEYNPDFKVFARGWLRRSHAAGVFDDPTLPNN